jgi:hypothetical protein
MAWWKFKESSSGSRGGRHSSRWTARRMVKESNRHRRGQTKRKAIEQQQS